MPGTFSPPLPVSDPDMHHGTCVTHVPWRMPGSLTNGFLWSQRRGKRSRHSRRTRNPQFYVSGRPIPFCARTSTGSMMVKFRSQLAIYVIYILVCPKFGPRKYHWNVGYLVQICIIILIPSNQKSSLLGLWKILVNVINHLLKNDELIKKGTSRQSASYMYVLVVWGPLCSVVLVALNIGRIIKILTIWHTFWDHLHLWAIKRQFGSIFLCLSASNSNKISHFLFI